MVYNFEKYQRNKRPIMRRSAPHTDNVSYTCQNGSVEDMMNFLIRFGKREFTENGYSLHDTMVRAIDADEDADRKARKIAIVTAYTANGEKALRAYAVDLKSLKQAAFNASADNVGTLLEKYIHDKAATNAIKAGMNKDRKRFGQTETPLDKIRRNDKANILADFMSGAGRFASPQSEEYLMATLNRADTPALSTALSDKVFKTSGATYMPSQRI
jgi:hypothetical protein